MCTVGLFLQVSYDEGRDMKNNRSKSAMLGLSGLMMVTAFALSPDVARAQGAADLAPMPEAKPGKPEMIELGKYLFFDKRLSGDMGGSCASCHAPDKGWGDGKALSAGYPSMEYFRNAPTVLNSKHRKRFMWDGRLDGSDAGTLVRDMVTEAHTMNGDGRLVQERLKQVPEYVTLWEKAFGKGSDPYGPRMFNAIGEFIKSLETANAPLDKFIKGDAGAISEQAKAGYALFKGKANCVSCHNGPIGSDGLLHKTGVPEHPDVLKNPLRTITMLRHYATSGMPNYMNARTDVGFYAVTKNAQDIGKFQTAQLRDLKYTAPYMHNGVFATLDEVVDFYALGGGNGSALKPLNLSATEKQALTAFLLTLSGEQLSVKDPGQPEMQIRTNYGKN